MSKQEKIRVIEALEQALEGSIAGVTNHKNKYVYIIDWTYLGLSCALVVTPNSEGVARIEVVICNVCETFFIDESLHSGAIKNLLFNVVGDLVKKYLHSTS